VNIKINIKSISKTRGVKHIIYEVLDNIKTLECLILNLVDIEIDKYENHAFKALTQEDINSMLDIGKISFGFKYRESNIDRNNAKEIATLAFIDGLYVVFINQIKIEELTDEINLKEDDEVSLIRLTMLSGRY